MPVPYARQSTGPRDRMVRRTSEQPRWRPPRTYRRGPPDTPSLRGWISPDHDPCANPDPRLSVAYWRRLGSSSHRRQSLHHQPDRPQCTPRRPVRTSGGKHRLHLHFTTDQSFRADRKDITYDQHPDHQFRINRRATHGRIMGCKFAAEPGQIESSVDLPHHVIFGNGIAKTKLVEQLTLVTLQTAHHGSTSPRFASPQRNHASRRVSTDFCNKICHFRTHALRQI